MTITLIDVLLMCYKENVAYSVTPHNNIFTKASKVEYFNVENHVYKQAYQILKNIEANENQEEPTTLYIQEYLTMTKKYKLPVKFNVIILLISFRNYFKNEILYPGNFNLYKDMLSDLKLTCKELRPYHFSYSEEILFTNFHRHITIMAQTITDVNFLLNSVQHYKELLNDPSSRVNLWGNTPPTLNLVQDEIFLLDLEHGFSRYFFYIQDITLYLFFKTCLNIFK